MTKSLSLSAMALILMAAPAALAAPTSPAPVIAAERAFAADGAALGWVKAFKGHVAPGGVMATPLMVSADDLLAKVQDLPGPALKWWPMWAGIAASGDLGFTMGPYEVDGRAGGYYFTVWKRQPDGGWKWVFDGGPESPQASGHPADRPPVVLAADAAPASSPVAALAEVIAAEDGLAKLSGADLTAAYLKQVPEDGRLMGSPTGVSIGRDAIRQALELRPESLNLTVRGREVSQAGDLVFSFGEAHAVKSGQALQGTYARIWQRRAEGWRLVVDELLLKPKA